jgi:phage shock protein A
MGIMTRMMRLCKADVHGAMDQLEDKGLLLKQHLREMESALAGKEHQVDALVQQSHRLQQRISRHGREMDGLEQDLTLALEKSKDDIARMLIRKRRMLATASAHLCEQMETIDQEKKRLSEVAADQRLQYETLKTRAETYWRREDGAGIDRVSEYRAAEGLPLDPTDEEIELELLQRKEALTKGGTL